MKEKPKQAYVIKQKGNYLHIVGKDEEMVFKPTIKGASTYNEKEVEIVVGMLKDEGCLYLFKSKIKDKNLYERPLKFMEGYRKKKIIKQRGKK